MADSVSTWSWCQVQPETETRPCGRDIWGNSFVHDGLSISLAAPGSDTAARDAGGTTAAWA